MAPGTKHETHRLKTRVTPTRLVVREPAQVVAANPGLGQMGQRPVLQHVSQAQVCMDLIEAELQAAKMIPDSAAMEIANGNPIAMGQQNLELPPLDETG